MPKQEHKILSFHGGTNLKFDARDIGDDQNAKSQFAIRNPGRLTFEGSAMTIYDKTNVSPVTVTDVGASPGSFVPGYGLFAFSHDYDMDATPDEVDTEFLVTNDQSSINIYDPNLDGIGTEIIQSGDNPNPAGGYWSRNRSGATDEGWSEVNPPAFDDGNGTASLITNLGGDDFQADKDYKLTFTVGTATLNLLIGGGTVGGSGNLPQETFIAATNYAEGIHSVKFTPSSARTHLWFVAYDASAGSGTIDDVSCSLSGWNGSAKFTLGSRLATVKPSYYNVDGALRACDSNFGVVQADADENNEVEVAIGLNDTTIYIDDGASATVTYATGDLIQINQEIMYITAGTTAAFFPVIRGFANTKISTHAINDVVYFVNVPKYFGHIKQDRLFECASSDSINAWVEDIQTPQPPNNTRKSDGITGTLAQSAGIQSLRVYDEVTSSTTNFPTESEKVVLEFGDNAPDYGITKVDMTADSDFIAITTSAEHGLTNGDEIVISNVSSEVTGLSGLAGAHTVSTRVDENIFEIEMVDHSIVADVDWTDTEYAAINASSGDDWIDYKDTVAGTIKAKIDANEVQASGQRWVHITGITGVDSFNGVKLTTRVDDDEFYFKDANHGSATSASYGGKVQQLLATITRPGEDAIDEDLKRKWNFAMSFTYDGPGQEVQESLLTQGYKITAMEGTDGTALLLAESGFDSSETDLSVDDGDGAQFSAGDVIMLDNEQMYVSSIDSSGDPDVLTVVRGYNGSAEDSHSDNVQIYKVEELTSTATVDWTGKTVAQKAVIKSVYNHGINNKTWNARINGFKIYMRDVTDGDASKEWRLFSHVNFNKGTYTLFAADDSELILEQPATSAIATLTTGTSIKIKPIDTYLSENLFTEETIISAQYKAVEVVGRRAYIGNIRQGGRTYPDRMLRTPVNKFDTFPETNFIDVAVGDGDSITALKSFGDRLLQFKKNKVYIINVAGESEVLEAEYNNAGIVVPSQITKTNDGIAWINDAGLWYFDGKQVQNLTLHVEDDGYKMDSGDNLGTTDDLSAPKIGFDRRSNRLIYAPEISTSLATDWYIYDLNLKAYQAFYISTLFPYSYVNDNYFTNMINDANGDLIVGFVDDVENTKLNFYKWSNSDKGHHPVGGGGDVLYKTKDIDFGSPGVRKKIYKVYVTYKSTGSSGIKMKYATNGGTSFSEFSSTKSTNYDTTAAGFQNSSELWVVAELKPSSSINNVKSIQFSFNTSLIDADDVASTGTKTDTESTVQLDSSLSNTNYNGHNLYLYSGPAKYNSRKITSYDTSNQTATMSILSDKGYGNIPTASTKYILGSIASDFEINDITIVYRMKRVK